MSVCVCVCIGVGEQVYRNGAVHVFMLGVGRVGGGLYSVLEQSFQQRPWLDKYGQMRGVIICYYMLPKNELIFHSLLIENPFVLHVVLVRKKCSV